MFANALRGSEVMNTFDGVTPYTVFAPSNAAFVRFLRDPRLGASFYVDSSEKTRWAIHRRLPMSCRITSRSIFTRSNSSRPIARRTLWSSSTRRVRRRVSDGCLSTRTLLRGPRVNGCAIVGEQVFARDGVLHVIDCVLAPNFSDT